MYPHSLTLDLIRKDVELKSLLAEFEGRKTGLEKNHMEFAREREQELLNMRQVVDRESKMRLEQNREVCSALCLLFFVMPCFHHSGDLAHLHYKFNHHNTIMRTPFPPTSSSRASVAFSRPRRVR
jgi:hypothetical protein